MIIVKNVITQIVAYLRREKMNKIYIAGKITGLANPKELFDIAEIKLKKLGYICMNPSVLKSGFDWRDYMHICFAMVDICDTVYMLNNWKDSLGATLEHDHAKETGKKIIYEGLLESGNKEIM
jgi:hypothetical protein